MRARLTLHLPQVHCGHNALDLLAQAENWRRHIHGELALIMSRVPQDYTEGYMHQLWGDGRLHLVRNCQDSMTLPMWQHADPPWNLQASCFLQMRKRSPMSDPKWITAPWQTIPKKPNDLIVDILIEITGLLEDYDSLKAQDDHDSRDELRQDLVLRCWQLESKLALWLSTVHIDDTTYHALDVPDAPFSIYVLAAAHLMCIYWCACIYVYSTLRDLLSESEIQRLPPYVNPQIFFRSIAEAVTVMLHPSSGVFGAQLAYFPTAVVMTYVRVAGWGEEAKMVSEAYSKAGKDKIIEQFLASLRGQLTMAR